VQKGLEKGLKAKKVPKFRRKFGRSEENYLILKIRIHSGSVWTKKVKKGRKEVNFLSSSEELPGEYDRPLVSDRSVGRYQVRGDDGSGEHAEQH